MHVALSKDASGVQFYIDGERVYRAPDAPTMARCPDCGELAPMAAADFVYESAHPFTVRPVIHIAFGCACGAQWCEVLR